MTRIVLALAISMLASNAFAQDATCKAQATEKKLAGAALTSFMKKCETDAEKSCDTSAASGNWPARRRTVFDQAVRDGRRRHLNSKPRLSSACKSERCRAFVSSIIASSEHASRERYRVGHHLDHRDRFYGRHHCSNLRRRDRTIRRASSSRPCSGSPAHLSPPSSGRRSDGTGRIRARASSRRRSARCVALFIWNRLVASGVIRDPGNPSA